jgi:hypothetical protein
MLPLSGIESLFDASAAGRGEQEAISPMNSVCPGPDATLRKPAVGGVTSPRQPSPASCREPRGRALRGAGT